MTSPNTNPESKTILIIDDDMATCLFFKSLLSSDGFEVETATSGHAGLNLLKPGSYHEFDLILLDLMMPGYGGYEVLKELQETERKNVPIFIITARALDPDTVRMIQEESNVREFLTKPINVKTFKEKVHAILGTTPKSK